MHTRRIGLALLLSLVSIAAPASAQEAPAPDWRVDVDLPAGGVGVWLPNANDMVIALSAGAWFTHRSGHGAMVRFTGLGAPFVETVGAGGEVAYQYAFTLWGDLRTGVAFASYAGVFIGDMEGIYPDSVGVGPLGGATLTARIFGFTIGLDLSYRAAFTQNREHELDDVHGFAAMLRLGFAFWGY